MSVYKSLRVLKIRPQSNSRGASTYDELASQINKFDEGPDKVIKNVVAKYHRDYIKSVTLYKLWNLYVKFDRDFCMFDGIYTQMPYSSYFCSLLWLKVEKLRFLFSRSVRLKTRYEDTLFSINEKSILEEYDIAEACYQLLLKTFQELLDFLLFSKDFRWEKRVVLKENEQIYLRKWIEISNWTKYLLNAYPQREKATFEGELNALDKVNNIRLLELHEEIGTTTKDKMYITLLNKHNDKCIKLNKFLQYSEAQSLASNLFVVEDIGKFHECHENKTNYDVHQIVTNSNQILKESSYKSSIFKKNKYSFQMKRIKSIGPFSLLTVPTEILCAITIQITFNIWRLNKDVCSLVSGFDEILDQVLGTPTSKISKVPFDKDELEALKLNKKTCFWIYLPPINKKPMADVPEVSKWSKQGSPFHRLVLYGGFAFFDKAHRLLQVTALVRGSDLFFYFPLFKNLEIRQYRFKDKKRDYDIFPINQKLYNSNNLVFFATPKEWSQNENEEEYDEYLDENWAFVFKDSVEEDKVWPHYGFELVSLPRSCIDLKRKNYRPSDDLKLLKKTINGVRNLWPQQFPRLQYRVIKKKGTSLSSFSSTFKNLKA